MNIVVRARADRDLDRIHSWLTERNPRAASNVISRIRDKIAQLLSVGFEEMGRPGQVMGTRELVASPYIVVYEVNYEKQEITILAVFHGAQNRLNLVPDADQ